jgi:sialate O-acetylesterase
MPRLLLAALIPLLSPLAASAAPALHACYTDHAVLQADVPVPIRGTAAPGEPVTVRFAGQRHRTRADAEGRWNVRLEPLRTSRKPRTLTVGGDGGAALAVRNVLVGEVWLCSGQSNMAWPLSRARDAEAEIERAGDPELRLITVPRRSAATPQEDFAGAWSVSAPGTAKGFSAVGIFFGRELRRELGVPVGLVSSSYGGTPAESWTTRESLAGPARLRPMLERWEERVRAYDPEEVERIHREAMARWEKAARTAKENGTKPPRRPQKPPDPRTARYRPGNLYGGMIHPLRAFPIRGVIWYQGEANATRAEQYRTLFPTLIRDWRRVWEREDLPFLFVQLASFRRARPEPSRSAWPSSARRSSSLTDTSPTRAWP